MLALAKLLVRGKLRLLVGLTFPVWVPPLLLALALRGLLLC